MKMPRVRCALYTRKSSDGGLDQAFNSLDAQREACAADVRSQKGEGWNALCNRYDDAGISGATLDRPGLQRLMADIAGGCVDIVVVYKIDRLTRSLSDFARLVELFEKYGVSFVSVTQAFNTTTSMGRLMLNVLLSFAQFEREVTGERIRDKIAASKARGYWMGGIPPLGYDPPAPGAERFLVLNKREASTVRHIFTRYRALGSVRQLERELQTSGIVSKVHNTLTGNQLGGLSISRGALFRLLRNSLYIGKIVHKAVAHDGGHPPIVTPKLFEAVQILVNNNARRSCSARTRAAAHLLTGRLFNASGQPMSPTFSHGASGKIYRYYVSAPLQQGGKAGSQGVGIHRVNADTIERFVSAAIDRLLGDDPLHLVSRIEAHLCHLVLVIPRKLRSLVVARLAVDEIADPDGEQLLIRVPVAMAGRGGHTAIEKPARHHPVKRDLNLIKALRNAHNLITRDRFGHPTINQPLTKYQRRLVRLAFLAPDIQAAILRGRQPSGLSLEHLMRHKIDPDWAVQRRDLAGEGNAETVDLASS